MTIQPLLSDPHDAERALLGLALFSPLAYAATVERYRLGVEHFADPFHRRVFGEMQSLLAEGGCPEVDTVAAKIADIAEVDPFSLARLGELSTHACVEANAGWWAEMLWSHRARRVVKTAAGTIVEAAEKGDLDGAVEAAGQAAEVVAESRREPQAVAIRKLMTAWSDRLDRARARGLAPHEILSGWPRLDGSIGGLLPGELLVIGGPTSVGKSSLLRCLAADLAEAGQAVGIVSTEDTEDTWVTRFVADRAAVDVSQLRRATFAEEKWAPIIQAASDISRLPIRLAALRSGCPVADVLAAMRMVAAPGALLCVDYLQAIRGHDTRGRHAELSDALAAIKSEAGRLGARLVVASQQNREGVREGRREAPRLSSLKETGDAEVMAEAVALLWCRSHHEDRQEHGEDCMELHVVKAKNGRRGAVPLLWVGARTRYAEAP